MRDRRQRKHHFIGWLLSGILLLLVVIVGAVVIGGQQKAYAARADHYRALAAAEKDWILDCQTDSGLILYKQWSQDTEEEEQKVVPYFSSIAAWGLLSGTVTEEQVAGAGRYIHWYLDHLNTDESDPINGDGTIYDYRVHREGEEIGEESTGEYDSVDSYAALFLILAERYAAVGGADEIVRRIDDLGRVVDALMRTLDENGLSWVKADYLVQYTMDNTEVYLGLRKGADLLRQLAPALEDIDRARCLHRAETLDEAADRLASAFDSLLWNEEKQGYEIGLMEGEKTLESELWREFYPDSVVQLFPSALGLIDADDPRSDQLYQAFCDHWDWETMAHQREGDTTFYWCVTVYAAAILEDEERVDTFLASYRQILTEEGRGYPLYTGDAGWVALACGQMEEYYRAKLIF